jgi:hypothetical protein
MYILRIASFYIKGISFGQELASTTGEPNVLTFLGNSQGNDQYCGIKILDGPGNRVPLGQCLDLKTYMAAGLTSSYSCLRKYILVSQWRYQVYRELRILMVMSCLRICTTVSPDTPMPRSIVWLEIAGHLHQAGLRYISPSFQMLR